MLSEDPLFFWGNNEKRFPNLSQIAAKVLAIPASIASSERAFSAMNRIVSNERCALEKDFAADLTLLYIKNRKNAMQKKVRSIKFPPFGHEQKIEHDDYEDDGDSDFEVDQEDVSEDDYDSDDYETENNTIATLQNDIESLRGPSVGQKRSSSGREIIMPNKDPASVLQGRSHTRSESTGNSRKIVNSKK
jgi:hypothetical protein